ncbi:DUF4429 domain-containing protein [Aquabacter sp. CN5-332]|uniref:DUF4429 domain-containing protein n=1 Tax=Aquabacter sp. CN5-332 TaxID=3156608 RepID=UPI0032B33D3B
MPIIVHGSERFDYLPLVEHRDILISIQYCIVEVRQGFPELRNDQTRRPIRRERASGLSPLLPFGAWTSPSRRATIASVSIGGTVVGSAQGKNGAISFDGKLITITKGGGGLGTFLNQGIQGDRYILALAITAVEFRDSAKGGGGFIAFDFPGKNPPRGGVFDAMADENAVVFTADQREDFIKVRDEILAFMWGSTQPPV